jgi:SnoaL-like domain
LIATAGDESRAAARSTPWTDEATEGSNMAGDDRLQQARDMYLAFAAGDRAAIERTLSDDFSFSSPVDVGLDRDGYFERCWPGAGQAQQFEFVRMVQSGDEVIVTYELTHPDGRRGRNTEVLAFRGDQVCRAEVYFGWNVE